MDSQYTDEEEDEKSPLHLSDEIIIKVFKSLPLSTLTHLGKCASTKKYSHSRDVLLYILGKYYPQWFTSRKYQFITYVITDALHQRNYEFVGYLILLDGVRYNDRYIQPYTIDGVKFGKISKHTILREMCRSGDISLVLHTLEVYNYDFTFSESIINVALMNGTIDMYKLLVECKRKYSKNSIHTLRKEYRCFDTKNIL